MKKIIFFLFLSTFSWSLSAKCARGSDLAKTLLSGLELHKDMYEPYVIQGAPKETDFTDFKNKYGVDASDFIIPSTNDYPEDKGKIKNCVAEFEYHFKNARGEDVVAHCLVSSRIKNGKAAMGYSVNYCDKATEDSALAEKLNFGKRQPQ